VLLIGMLLAMLVKPYSLAAIAFARVGDSPA
jgi:hypothetical protein